MRAAPQGRPFFLARRLPGQRGARIDAAPG